MENTTLRIECSKELKNGKNVQLQPAVNLDGFEEGEYNLRIYGDDGSHGLPFSFADDEALTLVVKYHSEDADATLQRERKIVQTLTYVQRSTGSVYACTRTRSYNGIDYVWSKWNVTEEINIMWNNVSHINTYTTQGTYIIAGERTNYNDGLPIENAAPGHTVSGRLFVLDSTINDNEICVTQVLMLSNRMGGDGNAYIRTGSAGSKEELSSPRSSAWSMWGKLQTNVEVGHVSSLDAYIDNGIFSGVYAADGSFETFVMVVINNYMIAGATGKERRVSQFKYALDINGIFSYKTRVELKKEDRFEWSEWVDLGAADTKDIKPGVITAEKLSEDIRENIEKIPEIVENAVKGNTALVNGDIIVGLARDVYSRQGKIDTATFLKRTTAGGTSISDGVASIRQIGGNMVKNLVDLSTAVCNIGTYSKFGSVCKLDVGDTGVYGEIRYNVRLAVDHLYYTMSKLMMVGENHSFIDINGGNKPEYIMPIDSGKWLMKSQMKSGVENRFCAIRVNPGSELYIKDWTLIDLTEMYGAGNEPSKEECDKMFGTMDALPQGLTIAQPTGLKSTGYNQFNPVNVLNNKSVVENAIKDDVADRHIAVVECLPCKTGAGENNGYVIGYGEGDTWSDEGIEVYLSPLNPMEVEGELYMCKLEKDTTYGTYVPQIKGYLLVVTPTTDKLCVHLHWSGDRAKTDYEEYIESNVALPVIPEMSEWGLAGLCSAIGANAVYDTIDLGNCRYTRRIGSCKIKELTWETSVATANDVSYRYYYTPDKFMQINAKCLLEGYGKVEQEALSVRELPDLAFMAYDSGHLYLRNDNCHTISDFLASEGEKRVFYELLIPEEYPIVTKTAPNYIGSDYGVEGFTGSKVPLAANILFYMRSLVSETRNFLDRLMAGLGTSDVTAAADMIVAALTESEHPTVASDGQMAE